MLLPLRGRAKDEDKVAYVIYRPPGSNAGVVEVNGQKYYIDATHRLVDAGYKLDNAKRLSTNDFGKKSTGEVQRWMRGYPVHPLSGEKAKDSMLSGLALQAAITPVYTRHNEIKATPRRSWQEVSRLLGETKALLDASRISDKAKWQTVLAHASSFLAMARDAERQGDNPHFVGWTERAFMMTHHVLDVLESLARRTTARDAGHYTSAKMAVIDVLRSIGLRWARDDGGTSIYRQKMWKVGKEPSTDEPDLERLVKVNQRGEWEIATWRGGAFVGSAHGKGADRFKMLGARAEDADSFPYKPGALIKLPNGKITEVTKCLLGKNLFHEPEYHVSTKTGECVVVPVKTKAKDKGPCLTCGKPTPSDEHFCSATCEETWLAKKYPREWADMKRRGGKLEDNLPKPVAVNDADFKVGDHVTIEAGYGGKGGKMPEDFYRFGKDTPAVLTNVVSGGNVYVKVEGFPYNFKMPARALKGCANDAKRARLHRALDAVVVPVKTKAKDLALPDDDEGAIYTCITKDGVKHEIEALTARHANSIAEKRYGYANISVCPQESLKKRATDSPRKAPARLHRALDAVMDRVKAKDEERKIARWESKTGKYWVDLYFNPAFKLANGQTVVDAHYRGDSSGGGIQASTEAEAITAMQQRIDRGGFQPDASKTPMRRVK
jgi:hypothetical protein